MFGCSARSLGANPVFWDVGLVTDSNQDQGRNKSIIERSGREWTEGLNDSGLLYKLQDFLETCSPFILNGDMTFAGRIRMNRSASKKSLKTIAWAFNSTNRAPVRFIHINEAISRFLLKIFLKQNPLQTKLISLAAGGADTIDPGRSEESR